MSSHAPSHARRGARHRPEQVGRLVVGLAALVALIALALTVPTSWFTDVFRHGDDGPSEAYVPMDPAQPVRVDAASVSLGVPLIPTQADPRATLDDPPLDAPLVMWWQGSAMPGATKGQTLLIAHTDGDHGALSSISGLHPGDHVDVLTKAGTMTYEVDRVRTLTPAKFEHASFSMFKQDGGAGRLVMVDQSRWDGSSYGASTVVTAMPMGQRATAS